MNNIYFFPRQLLSFLKTTPIIWVFLPFSLALASCLNNADPEERIQPGPEPTSVLLIESDTITFGSYLGFTIGETAENSYSAATQLKASMPVNHLNMVSNIFSGMDGMKDKLPLYHTIFLDERKGTDSGVQITLEEGKIKSLFLNSGKELHKWPTEFKSSAIRIGDTAETLHEKLKGISSHKSYKNKFEHVNLITKDLSTAYDAGMADSPQWYFAYTFEEDKMDVVKLNIKEGRLESIVVEHYQEY